jgi:hypothetical protein
VAVGATAGLGLYQILTESMELYRQRARGIIDTGMQLDLNFTRVGESIDRLRDRYQILAHDSIAAMQAMGRVTGRDTPAAVDAALRMGTAYGMDPAQAGHLAGLLAMRGTGTDPLARGFAGARAGFGRGTLPMAGGPLAEELTTIAGTGGAQAVPMPTGYYGGWLGFLTGLGQRYREPGQAAATYGQMAQGLTTAPDPTTLALRHRALTNVLRQQGPLLKLGEGEGAMTVDLRTMVGRRIAMEQAGQSPEIQEAYRGLNQQLFGNDPEQAGLGFHRIFMGGQGTYGQSEQIRLGLAARGGVAGLPRGATVQTEQALADDRLKTRGEQKEFTTVQAVEAAVQRPLEQLGAPLVKVGSDLRKALGDATDAFTGHKPLLEGLTQALRDLTPLTQAVVGLSMALTGQSQVTRVLGLSLMGTGALSGLAGGGDWQGTPWSGAPWTLRFNLGGGGGSPFAVPEGAGGYGPSRQPTTDSPW